MAATNTVTEIFDLRGKIPILKSSERRCIDCPHTLTRVRVCGQSMHLRSLDLRIGILPLRSKISVTVFVAAMLTTSMAFRWDWSPTP